MAPNAIIINDCVYESIIFEDKKHVEFATIGENWNKTVTVYSAGKLLTVTGHKIGWIIGPERLIKGSTIINETICFNVNTISQQAIARTLDSLLITPVNDFPNYNIYLSKQLAKNCNSLFEILKNSKFPIKPFVADSGYFLFADISACKPLIPEKYFSKNSFIDDLTGIEYNKLEEFEVVPLDYAFCRWLTIEHKVAAMPGSLFYIPEDIADSFVRFAICQNEEVINKVKVQLCN